MAGLDLHTLLAEPETSKEDGITMALKEEDEEEEEENSEVKTKSDMSNNPSTNKGSNSGSNSDRSSIDDDGPLELLPLEHVSYPSIYLSLSKYITFCRLLQVYPHF